MSNETIPPKKSVGNYRPLSDEDIRKIHTATVQVLEETGVTIMHPKGLDVLASAGARVDFQKRSAKIPASVVEACIQTASRSFVMAGRDPRKDLVIDMAGEVYCRNGGGPGHVEDMETGQVRAATLSDVRDYARLVDALNNVHIAAPIYAQDTPAPTRDIRVLATMFASTVKPINFRLLGIKSLPYVLRMAEVVAGNKENLFNRPVITMLESPISPLKIPDILVESLFACGEYGIPLEICSMPIAGATGPITLAGSLLMSNIEMITAVVLSQLVHPGARLIFTPRIMVMDMAKGHALTGSIENALLAAAGVQLAREAYQLPVNMHGPYTDSIINDAQAGIENCYFSFLSGLAGANILTGAGHLEGGLFVSYPQLLIDDETIGITRRAIRSFDVDDNTLGVGAIQRSTVNDNLLIDDHTIMNLRKVGSYKPKLLTREPRQIWLDNGSKSMADRAKEKAKALLATYESQPLEPAVKKALDDIIAEAARELE